MCRESGFVFNLKIKDDILIDFFVAMVNEKKGGELGNIGIPDITMQAITWNKIEEQQEKDW